MHSLKELGSDVEYYIQDLLLHNQGKFNPYHNTHHCIMVAHACIELAKNEDISNESIRTLKIAALYHDIHHRGINSETDSENIALAIEHVQKAILPIDEHRRDEIIELIKSTEYLNDSFKYASDQLSVSQKILRDADIASILQDDWFQLVCHGLAQESGIDINSDWIQKQIKFIDSYEWLTRTGQERAQKILPGVFEDLNWLKNNLISKNSIKKKPLKYGEE